MNLMFDSTNSRPRVSEDFMSTTEWVVSVGAGLIAPFVLVYLIGCLLPREHVAARSIVLKQSPLSVWESITIFERIPGWWPAVISVERLADQGDHPVYKQTFQTGRRRQQAITIEVTQAEPPKRMETRIADVKGPFQGRWIYEIAEIEGGSKLTLTEHGEIANPFIRTMFRLTMSKTQFIDSYLIFLGRKFGEQVAPV